MPVRSAKVAEIGDDRVERVPAPADQVHLVDGDDEMRDAEQVGERGVPARLRDDAVARVDQQDRELRRRRGRHHVARVLLVPRRVGDDELAQRGGEVAVGDVDRDALFALGDEAVGEERQVEREPAPLRRALDRRELVGEDRLRVVEQAADQRALAVVDAARGQEAQHAVVEHFGRIARGHQK